MNTSLLYQPCTVGTRCYYHTNHSSSFLHREWTPAKKFGCSSSLKCQNRYQSICRNRRPLSITCTSAASTEPPSIQEALTELEPATEDAKPKQQPLPASRARTFTVQEDELVADKVLVGRVRAIMAYGAFVDMGAKIDGLLHISKLGEGFIRNVADVLTVGQEVKVQIIDADVANRRVSLKMFDPIPKAPSPPGPGRQNTGAAGVGGATGADGREPFRGKIAGRGATQPTRSPRTERPKSKYQKGDEITGVVKNLTRRGCFVQLPGEEEGFLQASEIREGGDAVPIESLIKSGQEVKVKVLRIVDGRVNLTMKEEFDLDKLNEEFNESIVATNPFELAFRKSPVLRKYLEETGKLTTAESKEAVKVGKEPDENEPNVTAEAEAENAVEEKEEETAELSTVATQVDTEPEEEKAVAATEPEEEKVEASVVTEPESPAEAEGKNEVVSEPVPEIVTELAAARELEPEQEKVATEPEVESAEAPLEAGEEKEPVVAENVSELEASQESAALSKEKPVVAVVEDAKTQAATVVSAISATVVKQLREQSGAGMMDCKKALMETEGDLEKAVEYLRKKGLASADKKASRIAAEGAIGSYVHDNRIGVLLEVNSETDFVSRGEMFTQLVEDLGMQVAASQLVEYVSVDDIPAELKSKETEIEMQREDIQSKPESIRPKIVEGRVTKRLAELALLEQPFIKNDSILVKDLVKQTIAAVGEKIQVRRFTRYVLGEGLEKRSYDIAAEVAAQTEAKEKESKVEAPEGEKPEQVEVPASESEEVGVSAALVKQLREETGAGMMDCKKALVESKGDFEKAKEYLRKKGLASAEKKAGRIAAEGVVVSYVHTGRIGVLMEINCETDFVARNSVFKELADDLAMQVVACPLVEYVSLDEVPEEAKLKEKEIEMQREDLQSKPEQIRGKIVEGRLTKMFAEKTLLEQPYLKDDSILIKDLLKKTTVSLGENIRVRRFVRYTLGEGIEKKSISFAEEVAAATQKDL